MTWTRWLWALGLVGCASSPRYLVAMVHTAEAPVDDALVALACGDPYGYALRTNASGVARIRVGAEVVPNRCTLTAAKPGLRTVRTPVVEVCELAAACPQMRVELTALAPAAAAATTPDGADGADGAGRAVRPSAKEPR